MERAVNEETTLPPLNRRQVDPRIAQLVTDVAEAKAAQVLMQKSIDENTKLTSEMSGTVSDIRDLLASFRVINVVAKWLGVVAVAAGAIVTAYRQIKG